MKCIRVSGLLLAMALAPVLQAQSAYPVYGQEVFLTGAWNGAGMPGCSVSFGCNGPGSGVGGGDGDWDNIVLEDATGQTYVFEFHQQVPVPGLTLEPYNGLVFPEGPYYYESLFVNYVADALAGAPHHHPIPTGGNPDGFTWVHDPMAMRIFRSDGMPFRLVSVDIRNWVNSAGLRMGNSHTPSEWGFMPVPTNDPVWTTIEMPLLTDAAAGDLGASSGGPFDVLNVNGSGGGVQRRADIGVGQSLSLSMNQPPTTVVPADFIIFGYVGIPLVTDSLFLPYIGSPFVFTPCDLAPSQAPVLFTVAASGPFSNCGMLLPATRTPWTFVLPGGVPVPGLFTLQAVCEESSLVLKSTNAVTIRIQ